MVPTEPAAADDAYIESIESYRARSDGAASFRHRLAHHLRILLAGGWGRTPWVPRMEATFSFRGAWHPASLGTSCGSKSEPSPRVDPGNESRMSRFTIEGNRDHWIRGDLGRRKGGGKDPKDCSPRRSLRIVVPSGSSPARDGYAIRMQDPECSLRNRFHGLSISTRSIPPTGWWGR